MQSLNTSSITKGSSPKRLSNEALLRNTRALVAEERKLTTAILWHMQEIQIRRLYAEKGYASLFEYAVQGLGYSEAAAGRRIAAMRLLVDVPEIEPALQNGDVSLSTLSTIQSFIQRKEKPVSKSEKKELVLSLQGKSRRECEKYLIALDPVAATPKERERVVSPTQTEIRFIADDELMQKLKSIKDLDGHVLSNPSYLELFHRMADLALKELDPLSQKKIPRKKPRKPSTPMSAISTATPSNAASKATSLEANSNMTPPAELKTHNSALKTNSEIKEKIGPTHFAHAHLGHNKVNRRYIPAALKREIWRRDLGQCSYQSADGKKCSSRYALEIDHLQPLALGGKTELSNLRLLCRAHNQQQAFQKLSDQTMLPFVRH